MCEFCGVARRALQYIAGQAPAPTVAPRRGFSSRGSAARRLSPVFFRFAHVTTQPFVSVHDTSTFLLCTTTAHVPAEKFEVTSLASFAIARKIIKYKYMYINQKARHVPRHIRRCIRPAWSLPWPVYDSLFSFFILFKSHSSLKPLFISPKSHFKENVHKGSWDPSNRCSEIQSGDIFPFPVNFDGKLVLFLRKLVNFLWCCKKLRCSSAVSGHDLQ